MAMICLAATLANAQAPARKLLLLFTINAPTAITPAQMQAAFKHNSSVLLRRAEVLNAGQVQLWQPQPNQIGIALPDTVDTMNAKALLSDNVSVTFHLNRR